MIAGLRQARTAEETGYTATDWHFVCTIHNAIAYSDEHLDLFLARGLVGQAKLDEGEFLETFTATVPEMEMVPQWPDHRCQNDYRHLLTRGS